MIVRTICKVQAQMQGITNVHLRSRVIAFFFFAFACECVCIRVKMPRATRSPLRANIQVAVFTI